MIINKYLDRNENIEINFTIYLTSSERQRTQQRIVLENAQSLYLRLPRGKIIQDGDILQSENGEITLKILAKSEPIITVKASNQLTLIKAAYHLGNRHIPLEITNDYLRFSPDKILEEMLITMGLNLITENATFFPEVGAYHKH